MRKLDDPDKLAVKDWRYVGIRTTHYVLHAWRRGVVASGTSEWGCFSQAVQTLNETVEQLASWSSQCLLLAMVGAKFNICLPNLNSLQKNWKKREKGKQKRFFSLFWQKILATPTLGKINTFWGGRSCLLTTYMVCYMGLTCSLASRGMLLCITG